MGLKREFMRVVIALERNGRVLNRMLLRIVDNPCNGCGFLTAFVLAMSCHDTNCCERNECAEYPNNSGGDRGHQAVRSTTPVNTNLPARAILSNAILTPILLA